MGYPNREKIMAERKLFDEGGGLEFVREQILVLPSIGKHKETGEPWPAFHRCMICGQHPEPMGDNCLRVGPYHELPFCEFCVTEMYNAVKGKSDVG